jgi:hypothetical protein
MPINCHFPRWLDSLFSDTWTCLVWECYVIFLSTILFIYFSLNPALMAYFFALDLSSRPRGRHEPDAPGPSSLNIRWLESSSNLGKVVWTPLLFSISASSIACPSGETFPEILTCMFYTILNPPILYWRDSSGGLEFRLSCRSCETCCVWSGTLSLEI